MQIALLAAGADVSALHFVGLADNFENIIPLLNAGADINLRNAAGDTPLHIMEQFGTAWGVASLLRNGADPTLENNEGKKPADLAEEGMDIIDTFGAPNPQGG